MEDIQLTANGGQRLDKEIVAQIGERLTRTQIQTLIRDGQVTVDGELAKAGVKPRPGAQIAIQVPPPRQDAAVEAEPIALNVLYEDDDLAVIDKPAGLVVHPGAGNETGTLVNALLARYPGIGEIDISPKRRGIVHRLDKETSGLILVARNTLAMRKLMRQFQYRTVEKSYIGLTERAPKTSSGRIEAPIARDPNQRRKMMVTRDGKSAVSEFFVIEQFKTGQALIKVRLLTGRTHQIRVHMAFVNAPLVGDSLYGARKQSIKLRRQFLHAARLCFDQPTTGERLCFESSLPDELEQVLVTLRRQTFFP